MSILQDASTLRATPVRPTRKVDLMVISEMPGYKILWFLIVKYRVGILTILAFLGFTRDNVLPLAARMLFDVLFR